MKLSALTIGQRVSLGFALLLLLGSILGGFATHQMLTSASGAKFLFEAVAPQAEVASNLAQASSFTQRAARGYGFTGDPEQLAAVQKHLAEVRSALDAARKLASSQPELTALRDAVVEADKALAAYDTQFKTTVGNLESLAKIRTQLDTAAADFVKTCTTFIDDQNTKLAVEIKAAAGVEKLEERRRKLTLANELLELGNTIRVTAFKAQALRQPELLDKVLPLFGELETTRKKLLPITQTKENLDQLEEIGKAAAQYDAAVDQLVENFTDSKAITAARVTAGNEFDKVVEEVMSRSIKRTLDYAQDSSLGLSFASSAIITGLIVEVVLGLAAAVLIIRGVNRALSTTADSLSQGSLQVAAASGQVSSASQALAEGSSEQAASLEEISSSIEELASMTKRNAENARAGKVSAGHARGAAEAGAAEMERMQAAMNAIQQSSNDISKIIKTIDEIAFQTNILALNAAVEAARAGEAGAGFAVVADEVRSLAQRSAIAAKETADKIADATSRSAQGVELSTRVSAGLQQILEKSREVDRLVTEVATASNEQSEGITQINTAVSQMDKVTQSNAAGAEETASAAEELNAQSQELRNASAQLAALVGLSIDASTSNVAKTKPANTAVSHETSRAPVRRPPATQHVESPVVPTPPNAGAGKLSFHD
jgi:methyl-accepting chemotaxis protein